MIIVKFGKIMPYWKCRYKCVGEKTFFYRTGCGAILELEEKDVQVKRFRYGDLKNYAYFKCPCCNTTNKIKPETLPKSITSTLNVRRD